jgi:hypothetical protein
LWGARWALTEKDTILRLDGVGFRPLQVEDDGFSRTQWCQRRYTHYSGGVFTVLWVSCASTILSKVNLSTTISTGCFYTHCSLFFAPATTMKLLEVNVGYPGHRSDNLSRRPVSVGIDADREYAYMASSMDMLTARSPSPAPANVCTSITVHRLTRQHFTPERRQRSLRPRTLVCMMSPPYDVNSGAPCPAQERFVRTSRDEVFQDM